MAIHKNLARKRIPPSKSPPNLPDYKLILKHSPTSSPQQKQQATQEKLASSSNISIPEQVSPPTTPKIASRNPACCLFVANMGNRQSDLELIELLKRHFGVYGKVDFVKITRDIPTRPVAFVHFHFEIDAQRAFLGSQGALIAGRKVRLEPCRINRTILVRPVSPFVDQKQLLQVFNQNHMILPSIIVQLNNPLRFILRFEDREVCENVLMNFQQIQGWGGEYASVQVQKDAGLPKDYIAAPIKQVSSPLPKILSSDIAISTILVKNIPPGYCVQDRVRQHFSRYGQVQNILVNQSGDNLGQALIVFLESRSALQSLEEDGTSSWCGRTITVEMFRSNQPKPTATKIWQENVSFVVPLVARDGTTWAATPVYTYPYFNPYNITPMVPPSISPMVPPIPGVVQVSPLQLNPSAPEFVSPSDITPPVSHVQQPPSFHISREPSPVTVNPSVAKALRFPKLSPATPGSPFPTMKDSYFAAREP